MEGASSCLRGSIGLAERAVLLRVARDRMLLMTQSRGE
jgi:hypothetical protein